MMELRCPLCGRSYALDEVEYTCPACGQVGTLDVLLDYDTLRASLDRDRLMAGRDPSMWRYRDLLPLPEGAVMPPLRVGGTPLIDAPRLAADMGVRQALVKDDGQNPTGSLKDRASALVVTRGLALGRRIISAASTGNAAAALAGVGASVQHTDVEILIFVPATAPEAKIAQLLIYGATVLLIEDSYDVAFDLCMEMSLAEGWYSRNTGVNPFTTEGKKTVAFEMAEALNWQMPDAVIVSVGDGNIISGVYKGFWDLLQLGWIQRIPRLIGVQAEGSSALVHAWQNGLSAPEMTPQPAETIADSISASLPRDRAKALRAVRDSGGAFVAVSDAHILESIPRLARLTGVFAEPAAAAVYAGAQLAVQSKLVQPDEQVVLLLTGNGLKDVKRARQAVGQARRVPPDQTSIREALEISGVYER